jgi:hypothetical protein
LDFDFLEGFGRSSGDGVANVVDTPGEGTLGFAKLFELNFNDAARNTALDLFKSEHGLAVKFVLRRRSNFCRQFVAESVIILEGDLSHDRELIGVEDTVNIIRGSGAELLNLTSDSHLSSNVEALVND